MLVLLLVLLVLQLLPRLALLLVLLVLQLLPRLALLLVLLVPRLEVLEGGGVAPRRTRNQISA